MEDDWRNFRAVNAYGDDIGEIEYIGLTNLNYIMTFSKHTFFFQTLTQSRKFIAIYLISQYKNE